MKNLFLLLILSLISCKKEETKVALESVKEEKSVTEIISELSKSDTITHLDLSHKKLDSIPDLSMFLIESLDLSYNNLDTLILNKLPLSLKKLKCTHNNLKKFIATNYKNSSIPELIPYHTSDIKFKEIDLSFNKLNVVVIKTFTNPKDMKNVLLRKVILSNNNIEELDLNDNVDYLDVSNNPNLPKEVNFSIKKIDTLLQKNNLNKLKTKRIQPPGPIICSFEDIYATFPKTLKNAKK